MQKGKSAALLFFFSLITLIFLSLTLSCLAEENLLSGRAALLDWDESHRGFSFKYQGSAGSEMDFFIADRGEKSVIHSFDAPGVIDMGQTPLEEINEAPGQGYKDSVRPFQGHSYVIRSRGKYAKIHLEKIFLARDSVKRTITEFVFDWVIQPDGTRDFAGGSNSLSTPRNVKEALGEVLRKSANQFGWEGMVTTIPWRNFESVYWTGAVKDGYVSMGIIIHKNQVEAEADLKLFSGSGYGYNPTKFHGLSGFLSETAGKPDGLYWRMGRFVLYVTDPISENHLYEAASALYSQAKSAPVFSWSDEGKREAEEGGAQENDEIELFPTADGQVYAYSYRNWNRANRGKWDRMRAGWDPVGGESRAYLKFNVNKLPSGGPVTLKLYQKKVLNDAGAPLGIYRVTSKWKEGDNTYISGRQSPTADPGELSWEQQPSFEEQPAIVFRAPSEGLLQIEITPLVRQWQSGAPNHGLMIRPAAYEPSRKNSHVFSTKESTKPEEKPRLVAESSGTTGSGKSDIGSGENGTEILYRSYFNDESLDDWKTVNGNWRVEDGKLAQLSNYFEGSLVGGTYAYTGTVSWTDYSVSARVMSRDDDKIGFVFRYLDSDNYYIFSWQSDHGSKMRFTKIVDGKETDIAENELGYQQNRWYNLKVKVEGNRITAYLDEKKVLSAIDNSLSRGMAGLYCHGNEGGYFDNFVVRSNKTVGDVWSDTDADGVENSIDRCPDTPAGTEVNSQGCEVQKRVVIKQGDFQLESGKITLTNEWKEVSFARPFTYPVVVAKPLSYNGTDPAIVDIKDVTSDGFEVRIHEWPYIEGEHVEENLSYLAVERGHFELDSGLEIEADNISTSATGASGETTTGRAQRVNFFSNFSGNPVVFTARTTIHGEDPVATRVDKVTNQGFNVLMQEQEASEQFHCYETLGYVALETGPTNIGGETLVVGRVRTDQETATVTLPLAVKVKVHLDEEQSLDEEKDHVAESVGYLSFSSYPGLFIADIQTIEGSDTTNLRYEEVSGGEKETHTVIIDGSVNPEIVTRYQLVVTGIIDPIDGNLEGHQVSFNPTDSINGKVAIGQVDRGKDGYRVTGQISSIQLDHPEATVVLVDGEKVQDTDTFGPPEGKASGTVTLKHWGGEGSYEEGFDFSEGGIQRDGENGPDRPSLNPDFFYTGNWERSFPTTVAHDATQPLKRIDYGRVNLDSVDEISPPNDPRFEEGHLKVGHVYGFYTKEGSYVLLKVQGEEKIPREDWHVGTLTFSWKLLTKNSGPSASGCQYEIGGLWTEVSGYCKGTLWDIRLKGEKVPRLSATVKCADGYRGKWEARNVVWGEKCQLNYQIVHECSVCKGLDKTRVEDHRLQFLNNHSAILTLDNGSEIHLGRPK